ncbi:hypothetical protein [Clavibacter michiganensis]|uniref:hypothetical protein n=1 Tax=Clavibacter michiganensis TaxID=28447 RepID=UPI003EBC124E
MGEFWKIIGKYMARGFRQENPGKTICKTHVTDNYSPDKGHADNTEALSADLSASGANSYLVLFTPFAASIAPSPSCDICSRSRLAIAGSAATDLEARRLASPAYRALFLEKSSKSYVELDDNKHDLFPDIEFSDGSFARIRTLTGSEDDNVAGLVRDLGVLNDAAQDLWSSYTNTHDREVAFGALGVTASPEGPSKHKNRKAMDARIFSFTEGDVMCEWHTKLRPDINRVYFAVSKGKVKVGLITDHLP